MSAKIHELTPANLNSVPAMLRYWAAEMDAGRSPTPRAALLIQVPQDEDKPPFIAAFGDDMSRLEEIGVLYAIAQQHAQMDGEPE